MPLRLHQFLKNLTRKNWQSLCDGNRTLDFRYDSIKNKKLKIEENHQKNLKDILQNSMKNALLSFESGIASRRIRKLLLPTVAKHCNSLGTSQAPSVVGPHLCRVCDGSLDRRTALSKLCSHSTKDARII